MGSRTLPHGKEIDDTRDDGLEVVPQPGFQQQQQREDDP